MWFEDFAPGQRWETATRTLTEAEIIAFAAQWDKQSFHLDPKAAEHSIFGGLIASGFHTLVVAFDLVVAMGVWNESSQGSPGIDALRWLRPVRPGDTLRVTFEVVSVTPSRKGDRGYVLWDHTCTNQNGEPVLTFRSTGISLRRPAE